VNEEALAHWGALTPKTNKIFCKRILFGPNGMLTMPKKKVLK
jgi:hypothetical protein